jgi:hypothetical protein
MYLDITVEALQEAVCREFFNRTAIEGRKRGVDFGISLGVEVANQMLWLRFAKGDESHTITVPVPFEEDGVTLICQNMVKRAVTLYYDPSQDLMLGYMSAIRRILLDDPTGLIPAHMVKSGVYLTRVINSFGYGTAAAVTHNLQRAINEVTNMMPLHETSMKSWVMNNRITIIDPEFEELANPADRLKYQVEKNRKYFDRGWTSVGLPDGTLADKNYMLMTGLRQFTPFGLRFHNPARNLYSATGMTGDEFPLIKSRATKDLEDRGIYRKGFNLFTCFADIPEVWEDQIMVDLSHADKIIWKKKRYQLFGDLLVKPGDQVKKGDKMSVAPDGKVEVFKLHVDKARIESVELTHTNVGGVPTQVYNVTIEYGRFLKDGTKITNFHGNKGVIRLKDLGVAVNPVTGEQRKIDVIVSAESVRKRKNYGQLLEALLSNIHGDKEIVMTDDTCPSMDDIKGALVANGYRADGCWQCDTYAGKFDTVCGNVFWGVIKDVESAVWDDNDTTRENGRGLRTAGLKLSTVEFRALETIFGPSNDIGRELFTYIQGSEDLQDLIKVMRSKVGAHEDERALTMEQVMFVDQTQGTIVPKEFIEGTVVDDETHPSGFFLQLPFVYEVTLDGEGEVMFEGMPRMLSDEDKARFGVAKTYQLTKVYVPSGNLRRCWRHGTGKYGLSEVGTLVNNMVTLCTRHILQPEDGILMQQAYRSVYAYITGVTGMMGTKRGEIATFGMSVRYPYSCKGVATLSNSLPKNVVAIHREMAKLMEVHDGEVVLCERFPCLGFTSIRLVKVKVIDDPLCRYTIRVSGNSLGSQGLDFDGDVIYLFALKSPEARMLLEREWANPNRSYYSVIKELNCQKGAPHVKALKLDDYEIEPFADVTVKEHETRVGNLTGVKAYTGPVIAFLYNLMRVLENSDVKNDKKANVGLEVFFNIVGESVFDLKHGEESPHEVFVDAICMGDVETLVEKGFDRSIAATICNVLARKAAEVGVSNLRRYHLAQKARGGSTIVNRVVREQNRIYFASRSKLETCCLLECLDAPTVDIPSRMLKLVLSGKSGVGKSPLEEALDSALICKLKGASEQAACRELFQAIDEGFGLVRTCDELLPPEDMAQLEGLFFGKDH